MCQNSCTLFYGPLYDAQQCPECKAPRCNSKGVARKFTYIPLSARLLLQLQNADMKERLSYAYNYIESRGLRQTAPVETADDVIGDIFDGYCFRALLANGVVRQHRYNIYLGISTDGFIIFKRYSC